MIETILLSWLAIAAGYLAARQTRRQWPQAFCVLGTLLLTWQAWPANPPPIEATAHAAATVLLDEVVAIPAGDEMTYHRPDCPKLQPIRYVSAKAAELMGRWPCRRCLKRVEASDLQTSLRGPGSR